jgi:hypothetical protein
MPESSAFKGLQENKNSEAAYLMLTMGEKGSAKLIFIHA